MLRRARRTPEPLNRRALARGLGGPLRLRVLPGASQVEPPLLRRRASSGPHLLRMRRVVARRQGRRRLSRGAETAKSPPDLAGPDTGHRQVGVQAAAARLRCAKLRRQPIEAPAVGPAGRRLALHVGALLSDGRTVRGGHKGLLLKRRPQ